MVCTKRSTDLSARLGGKKIGRRDDEESGFVDLFFSSYHLIFVHL